MFPSLAEVAEDQASGIVAELYQDIRELTGAPLVNLVYRHLATEPSALEWAWSGLRAHMQSGLLFRQASALRSSVEHRNAQWMRTRPLLHSLPAAELAAARQVIQTYCHTNCLNMMALTHLLSAGPVRAPVVACGVGTAGPEPRTAPALASQLPALPRWQDLDEPTLLAVQRLNTFAETTNPRVIASLYRHLAIWPALLRSVEQSLSPLQRAGLLLAARLTTAEEARRICEADPVLVPCPPVGFEQRFGHFLRSLSTVTIAKMIPIGCLLLAGLDQRAREREAVSEAR